MRFAEEKTDMNFSESSVEDVKPDVKIAQIDKLQTRSRSELKSKKSKKTQKNGGKKEKPQSANKRLPDENEDNDKNAAYSATDKGFRVSSYETYNAAETGAKKAGHDTYNKLFPAKNKKVNTAYIQGKLNAIRNLTTGKAIKLSGKAVSRSLKKMATKLGIFIGKTVLVLAAPLIPIILIVFVATGVVGGVVDFFSGAGATNFAKYMNYRIEAYNEQYRTAIENLAEEYPGCEVHITGHKATIQDIVYVWYFVTDEKEFVNSVSGSEMQDMVNTRKLTETIEYMSPLPTKDNCNYDEAEETLTITLPTRSAEETISHFNINTSGSKALRVGQIINKLTESDIIRNSIIQIDPMSIIDAALKYATDDAKWLYEWYGNNEASADWSNIYVCYCLENSVHSTAVPKCADSSGIKQFYDSRGLFFRAADYMPETGNIIVLNNGKTGIVASVQSGKVLVIEANGAKNPGTVATNDYALDSPLIAGYCTPIYSYNYRMN